MDFWALIPKNWSDWAASAQVVQAFIVIIALVYAIGQVKEAGRARKLQATRELLNEIGSEEIRKLRHWVLEEMDTSRALSPQQFWEARRVAVSVDRVGYMVKQNLIPEDALFEWQQDEIALLWDKLEPIIKEVQKKRPNYCKRFKWLAEEWLPKMTAKQQGAAGVTCGC